MAYVLVVCAGITGWGCGMLWNSTFPTREDCKRALQTLVVADNGKQSVGEGGRQTVAFCRLRSEENGYKP